MDYMTDWIEIHDPEWTAESLMVEVAQRAAAREAELGMLTIDLQAFGTLSGMPQPPQDRPYNARLYRHLQMANNMPPPDTTPALTDSPATRTPGVGRLWQRVRGQFHELILFYVNRAVRQQTQLNNDLINTLNELTITVEAQQDEIRQLRAELRRLQGEK